MIELWTGEKGAGKDNGETFCPHPIHPLRQQHRHDLDLIHNSTVKILRVTDPISTHGLTRAVGAPVIWGPFNLGLRPRLC